MNCPHCNEIIDKNSWRCENCRHTIPNDFDNQNDEKSAKDSTRKSKKEIENINRLIKKATRLQNKEDYFKAFGAWDDVVTKLNKLLERTARGRTIAKAAGWVATIATFGIGPEDLIIVPLVNKALLRLFSIDLDFVLGKMSLALRQRQACIYHEDKLIDVSVFKEEITYFAYSYTVANSVENNTQKVNMVLSLLNPFHKIDSLKFIKSESELYEEIVNIVEHGRITKEMRTLNKYLKKYLKKKNKTKNILYESLSMS